MAWVSSTSSVFENSGTCAAFRLVHDARHVRVYGAVTSRSTTERRDPLTEKPHGAAGKLPLVVCSTLPLVGQGAPFGASGERVWPCALSRPFIFRISSPEDQPDSHFTRQEIRTERRVGPPRVREVFVPGEQARAWHHNVLQFFYETRFVNSAYLPPNVWVDGAMPGSHMIDGVLPHRDNISFYKLDLKNAFPNVVMPVLHQKVLERADDLDIKWFHKEYLEFFLRDYASPPEANGLALGPPASPYLFNLYAMDMDEELADLAAHYDLAYTRYLDDITFSSEFSRHILGEKMRRTIRSVIEDTPGMQVNHAKSQVLKRDTRLVEVTGMAIMPDRTIMPSPRLMEKIEDEFRSIERGLMAGRLMSIYDLGKLDGYHGTLRDRSVEPYHPKVIEAIEEYYRLRQLVVAAIQRADGPPREPKPPEPAKVAQVERLLFGAHYGNSEASEHLQRTYPSIWGELARRGMIDYYGDGLF